MRAVDAGHHVLAVVRPGRDTTKMLWHGLSGVEVLEGDLASDTSVSLLACALGRFEADTCVVIHAAGLMVGDDAAHLTQTVEPTRSLVAAMTMAGVRRLVLVSSLSIYGYADLPEGAQLDETTPTEHVPSWRDPYCRAKLLQEGIVLEAAQTAGFIVTALRPGVIYGPGRLWTARLGAVKGPVGLMLGRSALLPLTYVDHCADAAVLSANSSQFVSDIYVEPDGAGRLGAFEGINVVDDDLPSQTEYLGLLRRYAKKGIPVVNIYVPWTVMRRVAAVSGILGLVWPRMVERLPGILRPPSLHARAKPLRFSNCRLHDRLGWVPTVSTDRVVAAS